MLVEHVAGVIANFTDEQYQDSGAEIVQTAHKVWEQADVILKISPNEKEIEEIEKVEEEEILETGRHEVDLIRKDTCLICILSPGRNQELLERLAKTGGVCNCSGCYTKDFPGSVNGCIKLHGKYFWLPCCN